MSSMLGWGPSGSASGLKGTGYKQITSPTMSGQGQGLTDLLYSLIGGQGGGLSQGLQGLNKMASGDQSQFSQAEAPALRQHQQLLGNLASRFSGMGSGARGSSGFQNTASEATTDLAERLQGQRMNYQQQALQQLLGLSESLLNRPTFQSGFAPKKKPFWQELAGGAAQGFGQGLGMLPGLFL